MTQTLTKPAEDIAVEQEVLPFRTLLLKDRCDRCGAAAYVRAWKEPLVSELLFCGHHGRSYIPALKSQGFLVDDQTEKLYKNTKPMSGSNMAD